MHRVSVGDGRAVLEGEMVEDGSADVHARCQALQGAGQGRGGLAVDGVAAAGGRDGDAVEVGEVGRVLGGGDVGDLALPRHGRRGAVVDGGVGIGAAGLRLAVAALRP